MDIDKKDTALLITDLQNDFLSEDGAAWKLVGDSVKENKTVDNIERLFKAAKQNGFEVFISPHYYYLTDEGWQFGGTLEKKMHEINMVDRSGPLSWKASSARAPTGLSVTSPILKMARLSWPAHTKYMARRTTTGSCSSASATSARLSWQVCLRTCVSSRTCANCSNGASKLRW